LYCLNLPFSQLWKGKFLFCSCIKKDLLTNKGKFVSGSSWELAHSVPSCEDRIKKYQDDKARCHYLLSLWNFAVSSERIAVVWCSPHGLVQKRTIYRKYRVQTCLF